MAGNDFTQAIQLAADRGCTIEFHARGSAGPTFGFALHVGHNSHYLRHEFDRHRLATMADPDGHVATYIVRLVRELTTVSLRKAASRGTSPS